LCDVYKTGFGSTEMLDYKRKLKDREKTVTQREARDKVLHTGCTTVL